jgi:hypothetical protein
MLRPRDEAGAVMNVMRVVLAACALFTSGACTAKDDSSLGAQGVLFYPQQANQDDQPATQPTARDGNIACDAPYPGLAEFIPPDSSKAQTSWIGSRKLFNSGKTLSEITTMAANRMAQCPDSSNARLARDVANLRKDPVFDGAYASYSTRVFDCDDFSRESIAAFLPIEKFIAHDRFAIFSICENQFEQVIELHFEEETDLLVPAEKRAEVFGQEGYQPSRSPNDLLDFLKASSRNGLILLPSPKVPKFQDGLHGQKLPLQVGQSSLCQKGYGMCFYLRYDDQSRQLEDVWGKQLVEVEPTWSGDFRIIQFRVFIGGKTS